MTAEDGLRKAAVMQVLHPVTFNMATATPQNIACICMWPPWLMATYERLEEICLVPSANLLSACLFQAGFRICMQHGFIRPTCKVPGCSLSVLATSDLGCAVLLLAIISSCLSFPRTSLYYSRVTLLYPWERRPSVQT